MVRVLGIGAEENDLGLIGTYEVHELCDLIHAESAGSVCSGFLCRAALTANSFGEGEAYYASSRNKLDFQRELFGRLIAKHDIRRLLNTELPYDVTA
ncbi:beta-galactosidase trimerization domain-containing protein [Ectobacillus sp. SYSU M60031]|uniref:Beta-galactosidase trimerization domain-containing protein n=1 Tax=Ectobacillus ponti TaxID=2961894 RepID=A0AA41XBU3_9BACI|nr:beta-galactosidase trimerization domain-containing protein [Ectobacillus ponti]